jgi:hypothetical protein
VLVGEDKVHIHTLETEIQELVKLPVLNQSSESGLQALRDELSDEKFALQYDLNAAFVIQPVRDIKIVGSSIMGEGVRRGCSSSRRVRVGRKTFRS